MKKLLPFLIIVLLLLVIRNIAVSIKNLDENTSTLTTLKQELEKEKKEHEFLTQKLEYVKSDEFVDQQAREKLNLVKQGDFVVVGKAEKKSKEAQLQKKEPPNWEKWKSLFF